MAEAPAQSEPTEPAESPEPAAPKRPRKRKADDTLFEGFDFDQQDK